MKQPGNSSADDLSRVPLLDLGRENGPLKQEILAALEQVLDSSRFVLGPAVTELEQSLAQYCGAEHAIGCASGSDALLLALLAFDIGPGDEVILPSFTFFATASAVWRLGAAPVFVDIDPATFNIDPHLVEQAVTPATRAIIPVHLFGRSARMPAICELAERHGLRVIEDAAQAIGARCRDRRVGSWGDVGCFSFYPTKNLGGMGDGGLLTARDAEAADRLRLLAAHGMRPRYHHELVGINSRLDSLQAAALLVKLRHLDAWTGQRRENAARYRELFAAAGLDRLCIVPHEDEAGFHVWNQFTIRVPGGRRDALREMLAERGVGSEVYYPVPLHLQRCFQAIGYAEGSLPETERAAREVLSLPIFPGLAEAEQRLVVSRIGDCLRELGAGEARAA